MSADFTNFYNDAAALFPILLLTKTVSFRNRRHEGGEVVVHRLHIGAVAIGEAAALYGAGWKPGSPIFAGVTLTLAAIAALFLGIDLWVASRR